MSEISGLDEDGIFEYIHSVANSRVGLKDKDIPRLTGYAFGSVKTIFQRIVRKSIINPYKMIKANE